MARGCDNPADPPRRALTRDCAARKYGTSGQSARAATAFKRHVEGADDRRHPPANPPSAVSLRGRLGDGILLDQVAQFIDEGDSTIVKHRTVTFGEISDEMAEAIRFHGDMARYEDHLRSWVEKGEALKT